MIRSSDILTIADPTPELVEEYLETYYRMRFYTNVQMVGDHFLVRGYENGQHFMTREKFYPTLFVEVKRKNQIQNP